MFRLSPTIPEIKRCLVLITLSFELLQTFVSLIRSGGDAVRAMRELRINQPTMSKRLRYVQHAGPLLEQPWVVRKGKTWALTVEGQRVWPAVVEIVDRYENLERFLSGEPTTAPEPIRFACGQQMVVGLVRETLRVFRKEHSQWPIRIATLRGQLRIEGVSNGTLDLAIVTHRDVDDPGDCPPSVACRAVGGTFLGPGLRLRFTLEPSRASAGQGWGRGRRAGPLSAGPS